MKRSIHLVVFKIAKILEGPYTTPMSARPPKKEEKSHLEDESQEMSHLEEREGVEKIVLNEYPPGEAMNRRRRTSTPRATQ